MGGTIKNASGSCTSNLVDTYRVPDMKWYHNDQARPHCTHPPVESLPSSHFPEPWPRSHRPLSDTELSDADLVAVVILDTMRHGCHNDAEEPNIISTTNILREHVNRLRSVHDFPEHSSNDRKMSSNDQYSLKETAHGRTRNMPNPHIHNLSDTTDTYNSNSDNTVGFSGAYDELLPTSGQDVIPSTKREGGMSSTKESDKLSPIEEEDETAGDAIYPNHSRTYGYSGGSPPFLLGSRTRTRAPPNRNARQVESQKSEQHSPKKTAPNKVRKTASEIERAHQAAERARRKKIMDAAIKRTTAKYMKKSGGDLEKAAGFWFERENLKSQQPWPTLQAAEAAVEQMKKATLDEAAAKQMKKDALDVRKKGKRIEREQEEMEETGEWKQKAGNNIEAPKSMQQELRPSLPGKGPASPNYMALGTSTQQFPESYVRGARRQEPSDLTKTHEGSTLDEELAPLVSSNRDALSPGKELEPSTALRDTKVPSMPGCPGWLFQPGEQGISSTLPNRRRRRKSYEGLEMGEQWAARYNDEGRRPCVKRR
ncbi:hypothetical protein F5Y01DRAFT_249164 [Xylaria sp. FL0043]|nr:hypothetical protein F5Y01DRAFT_249164 [Xylaria sp. FL0043]